MNLLAPSTLMPKDFLRVDKNKTELFSFLSREREAVHFPIAEGYATDGTGVLCSSSDSETDLVHLAPCSQEEADTHLLLHAADAVRKGCKKVTARR